MEGPSTALSISTPLRFLAIPPAELSLARVLKSGQSFRWSSQSIQLPTAPDPVHEWSTAWHDRTVTLRQDDSGIHYMALYPPHATEAYELDLRTDTTLARLRHYFVLDVSLRSLYHSWSARDPVFSAKTADGSLDGLRVCRQDPWETMVAFICSANNNIPRITSMLHRLCETYGTRMPDPRPGCTVPPTDAGIELKPQLDAPAATVPVYAFPSPSVLSDPAVSTRLRALGFGYRAAYVASTAKTLAGSDPAYLDQLSRSEYLAAHQALVKTFDGVGPKVADCICLFGLGFVHVVPVDVHVFAIAKRDYGIDVKQGSKPGYEFVKARLGEIWGSYAGWAQQVLFLADLRYPAPGTIVKKKQSQKKRKQEDLVKSDAIAQLGGRGTSGTKSVRAKLEPGSDDFADAQEKLQSGSSLGSQKLRPLTRSRR